MLYLKCIAMLDFVQKKLFKGQRVQVAVTRIDDVQQVLIQVSRKLGKEASPKIKTRIQDLFEAIETIRSMQGIQYLPDSMRSSIISGIDELLSEIKLLAFEYFKWNQFEPTDQIVPIMRSVVKEALDKGLL